MKQTEETTIMQLPRKLLEACSSDPTREVLQSACVDAENRKIVCCDGRILATIPIPGTHPIQGGYITPEVWKMAKAKNSKAMEFDTAAGTVNGQPLASSDTANFPNWKQVIPTGEEPVYRTTINPSFFVRMADTFGLKDQGLTLSFFANGDSPCLATAGEMLGVIMPIRGSDDSGLLTATDADAEKLRKELATLRKAWDARLSERSDKSPNNPGHSSDDAMIQALRTEMLAARARVKELEAIVAGASGSGSSSPPVNAPAPKDKPKAEVPAATGRPTIARNAEKDGIELRYNGKPDDATRASLKANGFRWLPRQEGQPWAAKYTEERWIFAQHLATGSSYTPMPETEAPEDKPVLEGWVGDVVNAPDATPPAPQVRDPRVRKIQIPDF